MNLHYKHPISIFEVERVPDTIGGYEERLVLQAAIFCSINNRANRNQILAEQNTDANLFNISVRINEYSFTLNTQIKFVTGTLAGKMFKIVAINPVDDLGYIDLKLQSIEPSDQNGSD